MYDLRLIILSIAIAIFASYTALDLAARVTAAKASAKVAWLIGGAMVMGIGIWSMHFVAMLAFSMATPIAYDMSIVLVSMLPAVIASGGALFLASQPVLSIWQLLGGGTLMGIGIASMHYIGMLAMRMEATATYNPTLFILSIAIAIGASILALNIAFHLRTPTSTTDWLAKIGSAIVMGGAIAGMHYTGMAAVKFMPTNPIAISGLATTNDSLTLLGISIGTATFVILGFALLTSFIDRRLSAQTKLLAQQEAETKLSQLFTEITLRIRRSLKLDDVINTTVHELRQALKTDRVVMYRFNTDWSGTIIAESVAQGWMKTLGKTVNDPFREDYIEMYKNGRVRATNDIYAAGFTECHREILEGFQIKANLIAPIIHNNQLVGLLCAHECSTTRYWHRYEINLFKQLAIQVGIALEQASLVAELEQTQKVLRLRDRAIASASNGIFITDPRQLTNPIIFCNAALEKITGYSSDELLECNYKFLQGPDTDPDTIAELDEAMEVSRECQVVLKSYCKNGSYFWCELTVSPIPDVFGQTINFVAVLVEITSRKEIEEELRRSQQLLQEQLRQLISDVNEVLQGDLTVRSQVTIGEVGILANVIDTIIYTLWRIVTQVQQIAYQMNVYLGENSSVIQQVGNETLKQVEEINYAFQEIDNLNFWIQKVVDSTQQLQEVAVTTTNTAETAKTAMDFTTESILNLQQTNSQIANKVNSLSEFSQKISAVASTIEQIATQTNLLASDASIEATWMGDRGRSFVKVAEQISQLAVQSAEATQEIQGVLTDMELETSVLVQAIKSGTNEIGEKANIVQNAKLSLEDILEVSQQINHLVQSIFTATGSQTETSQAIASSIQHIAETLKYTADLSNTVSNSLQQTTELTQQLQAYLSGFKTGE
ncbi:methyl-accepting chemotaxis sensory transducer with phytochrome sensor [Nostoc linckia NIES-25]|nr:methyl-accepting chemotaxis sensory transducer with phytochrome sensor [Nostoc linckia NIES-25]